MRRLAALILIAIIVAGIFFAYPYFTTPNISEGWWVLYHYGSPDEIGAGFISDRYGAQVVTYVPLEASYDLNVWGLNLIWVGGSAGKEESPYPWLQPLSVIDQPSVQPKVQWTYAPETDWVITTPSAQYACNAAGKDFGTVTVGFDYAHMRYVVIVIGYSACATEAGARLVCEEELPTAGHYIVYRYTGQPVDIANLSRDINAYPYEIVEEA